MFPWHSTLPCRYSWYSVVKNLTVEQEILENQNNYRMLTENIVQWIWTWGKVTQRSLQVVILQYNKGTTRLITGRTSRAESEVQFWRGLRSGGPDATSLFLTVRLHSRRNQKETRVWTPRDTTKHWPTLTLWVGEQPDVRNTILYISARETKL